MLLLVRTEMHKVYRFLIFLTSRFHFFISAFTWSAMLHKVGDAYVHLCDVPRRSRRRLYCVALLFLRIPKLGRAAWPRHVDRLVLALVRPVTRLSK